MKCKLILIDKNDNNLLEFEQEGKDTIDILFKSQEPVKEFLKETYGLTDDDCTGAGMMMDNPPMSRDLDYSNLEEERWYTIEIIDIIEK